MRRVLPVLLLMCIITPGIAFALEDEAVNIGPITTAVALIRLGQTKTYTVESDFYPDVMLIAVFVNQSGTLAISVTKTDTSGELIGVMQYGAYSSVPNSSAVKYAAKASITPCTVTISGKFWEYGSGVVLSGVLATIEPGPYKYTITLSYN